MLGLNKSEIVVKFGPQVRLIARQMARNFPEHIPVDDLISVGFIGLMNAADRFDESRGFKFETYAEFKIRGAILDEIRSQDWVPRSVRDKAKLIERATQSAAAEKGESPTEAEVGKRLGLTRADLQALKNEVGAPALVHYEDPDQFDREDQARSETASPFEEANAADLRELIGRLSSALTADERVVLSCYYYRGLNLREIGSILDVSESRVSQLHSRAILKLRAEVERENRASGEDRDPHALFLLLLNEAA